MPERKLYVTDRTIAELLRSSAFPMRFWCSVSFAAMLCAEWALLRRRGAR